ncbi:uncharacterized protein BDR25DRAFT_349300 [Lindgomyces ingoldianus]|uniref:Uncharacterized protein n=1 Tax=Lindgomyces ingoldianus TaxID=673940 RepID=A0ACB6RAV5_9PLEO|nr:uncharacterized protein BDR25DRAFT_349300 [Lindgomyces ingoldianus]KAF2476175.1 hypothetical protein BDR25DRAFT_349300 [Lindgomyces ingoldianus]
MAILITTIECCYFITASYTCSLMLTGSSFSLPHDIHEDIDSSKFSRYISTSVWISFAFVTSAWTT